jgi:hypothetical protein
MWVNFYQASRCHSPKTEPPTTWHPHLVPTKLTTAPSIATTELCATCNHTESKYSFFTFPSDQQPPNITRHILNIHVYKTITETPPRSAAAFIQPAPIDAADTVQWQDTSTPCSTNCLARDLIGSFISWEGKDFCYRSVCGEVRSDTFKTSGPKPVFVMVYLIMNQLQKLPTANQLQQDGKYAKCNCRAIVYINIPVLCQ